MTGIQEAQAGLDWIMQKWGPKKPKPSAGPRKKSKGAQGQSQDRIIKRAIAYVDKMPPSIDGDRGHKALWNAAQALVRGFSLPVPVAHQILRDHFNPRCDGPWEDYDLLRKCKEADEKSDLERGYLLDKPGPAATSHESNGFHDASQEYGGDEPDAGDTPNRSQRRTDVGNGMLLAFHYGNDVRYCHQWSKWFAWNGTYWPEDQTGILHSMAKDVINRKFQHAMDSLARLKREGDLDDPATQQRVDHYTQEIKWACKSESAGRIKALVEMARSEPGIPIKPEDFDKDPYLLNCPNATIDLRTGQAREHRREDMLTKQCPTEFKPDAPAPIWHDLLQAIFDGNEDVIGYVRRLCGYILTGSVQEQFLWVCHGGGANGKSTFWNAFLYVLGRDYAIKGASDLLTVKRGEAHPTEKCDLFGRRLVVCSETEDGQRFAESLVKDLTGGESIRARRMREDYWEFLPSHKLVVCTNHRPTVRSTGNAMWRRLRLIPFTVTIPPEQQDKALPQKLMAEASGILTWAVAGCQEWQRNGGLGEPDEILQATDEYRAAEDTLAGFLQDFCLAGPDYRCRASELYAAYKQWAEASGEHAQSQKRFGGAMRERGFQTITNNGTWYLGLAVRHDMEE